MKRPAPPTLLGFHGLVFRSGDPLAVARRWRELTSLPVLKTSSREVTLGGPELFVTVRRGPRGSPDRLEEIHLAVEDVGATRRKAAPDALGGDSWLRRVGAFELVVRELTRAPARSWKTKRRPLRS